MVQIFTLNAPSKKTAFFFFRVKSINAKALGYKLEVGCVGDGRQMTGSRWFRSYLRMVDVAVIQHTWCFLAPGLSSESSVK